MGYLEQDPKLESGKTVKEIVQEGAGYRECTEGVRGGEREVW